MLPASCLYTIRVGAVKKTTYLVLEFDDKNEFFMSIFHFPIMD